MVDEREIENLVERLIDCDTSALSVAAGLPEADQARLAVRLNERVAQVARDNERERRRLTTFCGSVRPAPPPDWQTEI